MSFRKNSWKYHSERSASVSEARDDISAVFSESQIDPTKDIKYGKPIRAMYGLFVEYCMSCSIHGIKYFGERRRHWAERIFWLFAFGISLYGCGKLILNVYVKWDQSPVIVSFAEKSTPVWEIPFPAVTICPETKANVSLLNFTAIYHQMMFMESPPYNISDDDYRRMQAVAQICDAHLTGGFDLDQDITDSSVVDTLKEVAPTFDETMFVCKWRNIVTNCSNFFEEIMTEEGLCFTFNVLNSKELYKDAISEDFSPVEHSLSAKHWDSQNGYDKTVPVDPDMFPYRVFGAGARVGLFVLLRLYEQHLDFLCRGPVQGFKILLHTPGEVPQVSKHYFRVPLLHEVLVSVKPNMITTSEGLRHYEPNRRQCYFDTERQLRFFKVYTQRNCELECLANFTVKTCGCAKFSMPRDNKTPICGASKILCYNDAEDELLKQDFVEGLTETKSKRGCNCLPSCTSITYDAEISQANFDFVSLFNAYLSPLSEFPGMQPARLSIFFKENQFITSKRSELYGQTDFLANCGGLLGLFMGVSLLSIVEIIYFGTLRLCCNLRTRALRKRKSRRIGARSGPIPSITVDQLDNINNTKDQKTR